MRVIKSNLHDATLVRVSKAVESERTERLSFLSKKTIYPCRRERRKRFELQVVLVTASDWPVDHKEKPNPSQSPRRRRDHCSWLEEVDTACAKATRISLRSHIRQVDLSITYTTWSKSDVGLFGHSIQPFSPSLAWPSLHTTKKKCTFRVPVGAKVSPRACIPQARSDWARNLTFCTASAGTRVWGSTASSSSRPASLRPGCPLGWRYIIQTRNPRVPASMCSEGTRRFVGHRLLTSLGQDK